MLTRFGSAPVFDLEPWIPFRISSDKAPSKISTTLEFADGIRRIDCSLRVYVEAPQGFGDQKNGAAFVS